MSTTEKEKAIYFSLLGQSVVNLRSSAPMLRIRCSDSGQLIYGVVCKPYAQDVLWNAYINDIKRMV